MAEKNLKQLHDELKAELGDVVGGLDSSDWSVYWTRKPTEDEKVRSAEVMAAHVPKEQAAVTAEERLVSLVEVLRTKELITDKEASDIQAAAVNVVPVVPVVSK